MNENPGTYEFELIWLIANYGDGSKLLKSAKHHGFSGGTVMLGRGTVHNRLADFFGLTDIRKEVVLLAADKATAYKGLDIISDEFNLHKPNHGIAFTTSMCNVFGSKCFVCHNRKNEEGVENSMYHLITAIVDKGKAEAVIEAAAQAGSKGGTIINARGSGIHETSRLFSMEIEPEKEIVIILSEREMTEAIAEAIKEKLKINEPGNGIIFVQDTNRTYGIYK